MKNGPIRNLSDQAVSLWSYGVSYVQLVAGFCVESG